MIQNSLHTMLEMKIKSQAQITSAKKVFAPPPLPEMSFPWLFLFQPYFCLIQSQCVIVCARLLLILNFSFSISISYFALLPWQLFGVNCFIYTFQTHVFHPIISHTQSLCIFRFVLSPVWSVHTALFALCRNILCLNWTYSFLLYV